MYELDKKSPQYDFVSNKGYLTKKHLDAIDKYGMYDTRLVRNQDIELNKRIIRGGGKIIIIPDTYCTYLARETYKAVL